ncbi:hypothetical protein [Paenibacillus eucommiae]|uniref:Uncharacterized protein n=1 Tax=Paenibacillus eucommiae TaxID=1355755 RepID=A0ABS4IST3_9BACL|nr:hypothetical protein [Paenibacillus eucommiae]MBP1990076.1 hypothetical protein [Paenibacillus eucommiae]
MAFGISRAEMQAWKHKVAKGEIAFLTHFWYDARFPALNTVTKVGCSDLNRLREWCERNGLDPQYIHLRADFPHFDLIGKWQKEVLQREQQWEQIVRFRL